MQTLQDSKVQLLHISTWTAVSHLSSTIHTSSILLWQGHLGSWAKCILFLRGCGISHWECCDCCVECDKLSVGGPLGYCLWCQRYSSLGAYLSVTSYCIWANGPSLWQLGRMSRDVSHIFKAPWSCSASLHTKAYCALCKKSICWPVFGKEGGFFLYHSNLQMLCFYFPHIRKWQFGDAEGR